MNDHQHKILRHNELTFHSSYMIYRRSNCFKIFKEVKIMEKYMDYYFLPGTIQLLNRNRHRQRNRILACCYIIKNREMNQWEWKSNYLWSLFILPLFFLKNTFCRLCKKLEEINKKMIWDTRNIYTFMYVSMFIGIES